ncbi:MAG: WbqC family protein [Candidatus Omnitrophica bacterium]|nr:WbqC family protein [Candidatus Omnitrophota bacterium]
MIVAIQQPEHLPWIGFFNKMTKVDLYIYLDNVQFKKRYFENRNKIIAYNDEGWDWITVPVNTKGKFTQKINEVLIDQEEEWSDKYLNRIKSAYGKKLFFREFFPVIESIIQKKESKLVDLNIALIEAVRDYLDISTPTKFASEILEGKGSDLILDLSVASKADVYVSGPDGRNYLELDKFKDVGIQVEYHDYVHPEYDQHTQPFISHMSVIDLIFNYGKKSIDIIRG